MFKILACHDFKSGTFAQGVAIRIQPSSRKRRTSVTKKDGRLLAIWARPNPFKLDEFRETLFSEDRDTAMQAPRNFRPQSGHPARAGFDQQFSTTHWSVVMAADNSLSPAASEALTRLYRQYWFPLYAYIRRWGHDHHHAQDLTQSFFERLIEKNILAGIVRDRGKFRAFLLTSLGNFLKDCRDREQTQKRGGGVVLESLSGGSAEERYLREPMDKMSPDKLYERNWILTLLEGVLNRLAAEFQSQDQARLFTELRGYLSGDARHVPYSEVASRLAMSEGAVRIAVHRLRKRYAELFRDELLKTVASPEDLEDEVHHLVSFFNESTL